MGRLAVNSRLTTTRAHLRTKPSTSEPISSCVYVGGGHEDSDGIHYPRSPGHLWTFVNVGEMTNVSWSKSQCKCRCSVLGEAAHLR